jgi:restriction endonuclease S subunit
MFQATGLENKDKEIMELRKASEKREKEWKIRLVQLEASSPSRFPNNRL